MSQMGTEAGTGNSAGEFDAGGMGNSGGDIGGKEQPNAQALGAENAAQGQGAWQNAMAGAGESGQGNTGNGNAPPAMAVPASYQLSVPEGLGLGESDLSMIQGDMRGMGLSNEQANAVLAMASKNQQAALERYAQQVDQWKEATRLDPEIGGANLDSTVRYAMSALHSFDTEGTVLEMLEQSGYANNPDVIRLLCRMGKAMGEDTAVTGRSRGNEVPLHERLYGAANQ